MTLVGLYYRPSSTVVHAVNGACSAIDSSRLITLVGREINTGAVDGTSFIVLPELIAPCSMRDRIVLRHWTGSLTARIKAINSAE